jgi:hypothetical protein
VTARRARRRPKAHRTVQIDGMSYPVVKGLVEVEGHLLTKRQVEQLEACIDERRRIAERPGSEIPECNADNYARSFGLDSFLWKHKPTSKAKGRIATLTNQLTTIMMAISRLREYSFYEEEGRVGESGCALLQNLVTEAETHLFRLRHFANSMAMQGSSKLHEWVAREDAFERIGKEEGS